MSKKRRTKRFLALVLLLNLIISTGYYPEVANAIQLTSSVVGNSVLDTNIAIQNTENSTSSKKVPNSSKSNSSAPNNDIEYKTDRFILKYKNDQGKKDIQNALKDKLIQVKKVKSKLDNFEYIKISGRVKPGDFIQEIKNKRADLNVEYIQPDYELALSSNDTYFDNQWGVYNKELANIENSNDITTNTFRVDANVVRAWGKSEGNGIVVAVLDTGIDITHEDLKQSIWSNKLEIPDNGIDDDGNGFVDDINGWNFFSANNKVHDPTLSYDEWHGTHVAGIIAAGKNNYTGITGVAPKSKVMPLKVFENGTAYTSEIINAISYAEQNGAQIINASWGTSNNNPALREAIDNSNLIFVAAAGNSQSNIDINPVYPASFTSANVISVTAIDKHGNLTGFSNYGESSVDVAAPGEDIISTLPENRYGEVSGTSMSAAFVSGEAALLLSKYGNLTVSELKDKIINSSDRLSTLQGKVYRANKINAYNAINNLQSDTLIKIISSGNSIEPIISNQGTDGYSLFAEGDWVTKASMSTARTQLGVTELNGKVYAIGGYNATNGYLNTIEEFNPDTNTWTTKTSMTTSRSWLGVAALNGKIYAVGGYNTVNDRLNTIEEYDPIANTWTTKANMPTSRYWLGVASANGKIYAIGGGDSGGAILNKVEEYNPLTNTWTTKASMPTPREGMGVTTVNNKVYVVGGYNSANNRLNIVEEYNPTTNVWTTKTSMPTSRYDLGISSANGRIYAVGGYNTSAVNTVEEYILETNTWNTRTNMATVRRNLGVASVGGKLYAVGGSNATGAEMATNEEFTVPTDMWSQKSGISTSRTNLGAAVLNGKIYAVGGYDSITGALNGLEEYNIETSTWALKANMPTSRYNLGVAVVNGKIYAIGGRNNSGTAIKTVEEYDPLTNSWVRKADILTARHSFATTTMNGKIYIAGGSDINGYQQMTMEEYNPQTNVWTQKASMSTRKRNFGIAALGGKLYAAGGDWNGTYSNLFEAYDPTTDTWATKANLPSVRSELGVVASSGKIYAIGGEYNGTRLNRVDEYDPATNKWKVKLNMPIVKSGFGYVSYGKIYTIGGFDGSNYLSRLDEYTPSNYVAIPLNINAVATDTSINLTWNSVAGATGYDIEVDGIVVDNGINTTYSHNGLTANTQHTYKVRAKNATSISDWSSDVTLKTYLLSTPTNINTSPTDTTITVTWDTVADATGYDVEKDGVLDTLAGTPYVHSGISPNTQHIYRVRAKNVNGISSWSNLTTVSTFAVSTPANLTGLATDTSISLSWNNVANATGYDIEVDGVASDNGTSTTYVHTGLVEGSQHTYRVRAKNANGVGQWTSLLTKSTFLLSKPLNISTAATDTIITLTWDAVNNATEYEVEVDGNIVNNGNNTTFTHNGLLPGTTHTYKIRAVNANGTGDWTSLVIKATKNVAVNNFGINNSTNKIFKLTLTGSNILDFNQYIFTVNYDTNDFNIIDLSSLTYKQEVTTGLVQGTGINITRVEPGVIEFTVSKSIPQGKSWSGVLNTVKLRGKNNNLSTVIYKIAK